jgi:hypothetical protein
MERSDRWDRETASEQLQSHRINRPFREVVYISALGQYGGPEADGQGEGTPAWGCLRRGVRSLVFHRSCMRSIGRYSPSRAHRATGLPVRCGVGAKAQKGA